MLLETVILLMRLLLQIINAITTINNEEVTYKDKYEITAYTLRKSETGKAPGDPGYGVTASGATVEEGVTAACPRDLPLGTVIEIEGVGKRTCLDRGGAIKGKRIDVYFPELADARRFGRQTLAVTIIKRGDDEE